MSGHYERADLSFDRKEILKRGLAAAKEYETQLARRARLLRSSIEMDPPRPEQVVWIACELAAFTLSIDPPQIRAMSQDEIRNSPNKMGWASPSGHAISVRMSECCCRIAWIMAHEVKHRQQMLEGRFMAMLGRGETEPDAEKFQKDFTERFLAGVRCACRTRPVAFSYLLNR